MQVTLESARSMKESQHPPAPTDFTIMEFAYIALAVIGGLFIYLFYHSTLLTRQVAASPARLLILSASVAIPEIAIWILGFRGAARFKQYTVSIRHTKDGAPLDDIANALLAMVLYIFLLTVAGSLVPLFRHSSHLRLAVLVSNHLPALVALVSSVLFFRGARCLERLIPLKIRWRYMTLLTVVFAIFSGLFVWRFWHAVPRLPVHNGILRFTLSTKALLFSYVLPYLLTWGLGLFACLAIANYSVNTKGIIYKQLFSDLYRGILLVFVSIYIAQLFVISNVSLDHLSANLVLIYGLLVLGAVGFILIHRGSVKLEQIEKIQPQSA